MKGQTISELAYTIGITIVSTFFIWGLCRLVGPAEKGLLYTILKETAQETMMDPVLEAAVATYTKYEWGFNEYQQAMAATLAESGRETLSGPITSVGKFLFTKGYDTSLSADPSGIQKRQAMQEFSSQLEEQEAIQENLRAEVIQNALVLSTMVSAVEGQIFGPKVDAKSSEASTLEGKKSYKIKAPEVMVKLWNKITTLYSTIKDIKSFLSLGKAYRQNMLSDKNSGGLIARDREESDNNIDISSAISIMSLVNSLDLSLEEAGIFGQSLGISNIQQLEGIKSYLSYKTGIINFNELTAAGYLEYYTREKNNYFIRSGINLENSIVKMSSHDLEALYNGGSDIYGITYKITRVKDESENPIDDGEVRIGQTRRKLMSRFREYFTETRWRQRNSMNMQTYQEAMLKYSKDAFKIEVIAVCKNQFQYDATEEFFTMFYNKIDNN